MKLKFGTLEVEVDEEEMRSGVGVELPAGFSLKIIRWKRSYSAYLGGPWYDDSDLEGQGDTPQKAVDALHVEFLNLKMSLNDLHFASGGKDGAS